MNPCGIPCLRSQSTLSSKIKVCLRTVVLLYTYFYNISLIKCTKTNLQYIYFTTVTPPNIGKIRVRVRPKTNYFPYILSFCTNRIVVFNNFFFHWYVANQETNKTVPAIFYFSDIFWIIYFQLFSSKIRFQSLSSYCNKKMNNSLLGKTQARYCAAVC